MKRSTALLALLLAAFALASPTPGWAQTYEYTVYLDTDNDTATGCTVATAAGSVMGVEASLTAEVTIASPAVTGQRLETCDGSVMAVSNTFGNGYPVGFGLGPDALDVIELGVPLHTFGQSGNGTWRLTFGAQSPLLGAADLTSSTSVAGLGLPLTPVLVPATSLALLGALALTLLVVAGVVVRRNPHLLSIVAVVSALAISGLAWAAAHVLDGQIGDWPVTPLLTDPANDATQPEPQADIRQAFAERGGDGVYFRIDVTQTRLAVLIPPLLDTAFSIPENSPNGTVAGTLVPDTTGLASLLSFTFDGQTPAAGFGFDAADAQIEVADVALLDFETHPQFDLTFTAQVAGASGFVLPVAATVAIVDVNEAPQIAPQSFTVSEHEAVGVAIGTVAASDVDAGVNGQLAFSIAGGSGQALFAIGSASGQITVAGTLDLAASPYTLDVLVSDGGTPPLTATATMSIEVYNKNDAPTAVALAPDSVTENQPAATLIGTLSTTDVDIGDTHSYSLACATPGANDASVAVDGDLLRTAASLNFEVTSTLAVCVRSTDAGGLHVDQNLTVIVIDADDLPVAADDAATVNEDAPATAIDVLANDSDEDGDAFTIASTTQPANGAVAITGGGTGLTYAPSANYCNSLTGTTDDFTYTLAPGGASATVRVTVACINDAPVLTLPGAQNAPPNTTLVFGIDEGNAITVADVDAGAALLLFTISAEAGTLTLADTTGLASVSGDGTAAISATGTLAALNTALDGLVFAAPATVPGDGAVTISASIDDQGASGGGGAQSDSGSFDVTVDAAPQVTATTPTAGSTVANNVVLSIGFSEPVNVAAGGVTLTCGGANLITGGDSGTNVTSLAPSYTGSLPNGANCTLTVLAANVSDVDSIDPPDTMAADTIVNFSVDAAPTVTATSPLDGATVANDVALSIDFSETVDATAGAVTLTCGGPNLITGGDTGTGVATLSPTYTAPLPAGACTLTVVAANLDDSDTIDPPANLPANHVVNFTVDAAPAFVSATPAEAAVVNVNATVGFTFDEPVNDLGGAITLTCGSVVAGNVSGDGTATLTFTPAAPLTEGASCTATAVAASIGDSDAVDPPDHPAADVVRHFTVDAAPSVVSVVPANGAIDVGLDSNIVVTFSEPVNFTVAAFTLACPDGTPVPFTVAGDGTATATIDPTPATLPINTLCTFSVDAALVTDVDTADPPDAGSGVTTIGFTTVDDQAPTVTTNPANGGSNVALNSNITVTFSEPVTLTGAWFRLDCETSGVRTSSGELTGTGIVIIENTPDLVYTIDPTADLADDENCIITIDSANVADNDAIDPPNELDGDASGDTTDGDDDDYVAQFRTPDIAPSVTAATPANGALVNTTPTITVDFSESVNLDAGAFVLNCGGAVATTATPPLPANGVTSIAFAPTAPLSPGASCTATVLAAAVHDVDSNDPPDTMAANHAWGFSVDAAPSVVSTVPANGASNADPTGNITIGFSESVNFDTTANAANASFGLECPGGTPADFSVVTASPAVSVVLNPLDSAVAGATCVLTVRAAGITDADALDPPDTMAADFSASFSFAAVANDDTYTVTPHLTLDIGTASPQGGGVLGNDLLGAGVITGFGFPPSCNATAPGTQHDAGAANGRLTLNLDGSFTFEPPANVANASRTFCYTVTGGDTANIAFNLQNTELVWFVDAAAAAGGTGTQARPFQTLAAADAVDTANDTIYLAFNASAYTGSIALLAGERVIGQGSGSDLATITGIAPVQGSAFPALGGTAPTITCAGTCITLGTGNTLRGFTVGDSSTGGTDIGGGSFGTLTVGELTLTGNGRALALTNGNVSGSLLDLNATATGTEGMLLDAVGGTLAITAQANITNTGAAGVRIINAPAAASITFTGGLQVNTSNNTAVHLTTNNATSVINLGAVALTGNTGLFVSGSPVTLAGTAGTIDATNGPAIFATNVVFGSDATLASASSTNSGAQGIFLNGVTNNLTINGGSITNPAGIAFEGQGALATTTYAGTLSKTSANRLVSITGTEAGSVTLSGNLNCTANCGGILVQSRSTGTITFSGATKTLSTGANAAVTLANNSGATINFTGGGLAIATTSATGFSATGGAAAITVQGTGNSIVSTTGTALNVANTTIGASGLTFQSITSNGATSGIVLNTTGSNGGLAVTGSAGAGSGGTIQNATSHGILLTSTSAVSLNWMNIQNSGDDGIFGTRVAGLALGNVNVTNNGNSTADDGIYLVDPSGALAFTNVVATGNAHNNLWVYDSNNTGGNTTLTISGGSYSNTANANGNHGALIDILGTATLGTSTISGATFQNNKVMGLQVLTGDSAAITDLTISGNTFSDTGTGNSQEISMDISKAGTSTLTAKVLNNTTIRGHNSHAMNFFTAAGAGTSGVYNARIANNVIGNAATAGSGSLIGNCARININGDADAAVLVDGNNARQCPNGRGFEVIARNGTGGLDLTVTNNDVNTNDVSGFPLASILAQSNDITIPNTLRADIRANTVPTGTAFDVITTFIGAVETGTSTLQLVDTAPANATCTEQLTSTNTGSASANAGCSLIPGPITTPP